MTKVKLTVKVRQEVEKEIELQTPAYLRNENYYYCIKDAGSMLIIFMNASGYFVISQALNFTDEISDVIEKAKSITADEFNQVLAKAVGQISDLLPQDDSVSIMLHSVREPELSTE